MRHLTLSLTFTALLFALTACGDSGNTVPTDGDQAPSGTTGAPDCPTGFDCPPCEGDGDCPAGMYCDENKGYCYPYVADVECREDIDCDPGWICDQDSGICVPDDEPADGDAPDGDTPDGDGTDGDDESPVIDGDATADGDADHNVRCEDYLHCTEDLFDGTDCEFTLKSGYCLIDETCIDEGTVQQENSCKACRPDVADDRYSNVENGRICDDSLTCTLNDACTDGVCNGSLDDCDDEVDCTYDDCSEPTGCRNVPDDNACALHEYCDPINGCTSGGCTPDEWRCLGSERQQCDITGAWQTQETCQNDTPVCRLDGCVTCNTGTAFCEGREAVTCNEAGDWVREYCLGPEPACSSGVCSPCSDGDLWCGHPGDDDWGIYECQGGEWILEEDCSGDTPTCASLDGGTSYVCLECAPGSSRCDGLAHLVCNAAGEWQLQPCPADTPYCADGYCVACLIGDTRCGDESAGEDINDIYICTRDGSSGALIVNGWDLQGPCPAETPNCADGVCSSCSPGDTRCTEDLLGTEQCNSQGEWESGPDCEDGFFCDPDTGACSDGWSLYYDGANRLLIPDEEHDYDPNAEFTLEAWIFPTELTGNCNNSGNAIMEKWLQSPVGNYILLVCNNFDAGGADRPAVARFGAAVEYADGSTKTGWIHSSNNAIDIGAWNHVATVWAEDRLDLYVNGVLEAHAPNTLGWSTPFGFQQDYLAVGQLDEYAVWGFRGYIDEVRVSKIARYEGNSYTEQMAFVPDAFTMGLWHFNDFSNTNVCLDASAHHNGDNSYGATYSETGVGETP